MPHHRVYRSPSVSCTVPSSPWYYIAVWYGADFQSAADGKTLGVLLEISQKLRQEVNRFYPQINNSRKFGDVFIMWLGWSERINRERGVRGNFSLYGQTTEISIWRKMFLISVQIRDVTIPDVFIPVDTHPRIHCYCSFKDKPRPLSPNITGIPPVHWKWAEFRWGGYVCPSLTMFVQEETL